MTMTGSLSTLEVSSRFIGVSLTFRSQKFAQLIINNHLISTIEVQTMPLMYANAGVFKQEVRDASPMLELRYITDSHHGYHKDYLRTKL